MKVKKTLFTMLVFITGILVLMPTSLLANVKVPHIFTDNMVIQRDKPVNVWGWADAGESVEVIFGQSKASAKADKDGKWMVTLSPVVTGGPYSMTIKGKNTINIGNILVGEVWVCSGQSNMEMGITQIDNSRQEIMSANYPEIRLFLIPKKTSWKPEDDVNAEWKVCTPENIVLGGWGGFSSVAFFFGRAIYKELNIPVGLIETAWGGTNIMPWTPPEGFRTEPEFSGIAAKKAEADSIYLNKYSLAVTNMKKWAVTEEENLRKGKKTTPAPQWPVHPSDKSSEPSALYNAMVHPIINYPVRGAIWYQGEADRGDGMLYFKKMKVLVNGWRTVWHDNTMPFYYVQLAPFKYYWDKLEPYKLPEIWEAQTKSLEIPNTGMAVTTDIGNVRDIHPTNKQEVGRRLSLWALAKTYGKTDIAYSGPIYKSVTFSGGKAKISFDYADKGLKTSDGKAPEWFEIAGNDKHFVRAEAKIDGSTVIVWSDKVSNPAYVRFGWNEEAEPNLFNADNLPASPFRTGF